MVLVGCAIVGDERAFTINIGGKRSTSWLLTVMVDVVELPYGALLYQVRESGIAGNAFLTTTHADYAELSRGNEQVKAMYLTEEMCLYGWERIKDCIRVSSAPDAIHVLVAPPTPQEIRERHQRQMQYMKEEALHKSEEDSSNSVWTSISRSVASWFTAVTAEKKND